MARSKVDAVEFGRACNGELTASEVAKKFGITVSAVLTRFKAYEAKGYNVSLKAGQRGRQLMSAESFNALLESEG